VQAHQEQGVDKRGDHLGPQQAERAVVAGGQPGNEDARDRNPKCKGVGEHVPGVADQRHAAGQQTTHQFNHHRAGRDRQRPAQPADGQPLIVVAMVMAVPMGMIVVLAVFVLTHGHFNPPDRKSPAFILRRPWWKGNQGGRARRRSVD